MPECEYCGEQFDGEDALLEHMGEAHEGDLGRIDQRRVDDQRGDGGDGIPTGPIAIALIVFISSAVVAFVIFGGNGGGGGSLGDLPEEGDDQLLSDVQRFESQGTDHVEPGTDVDYERVPPTSGTHYGTTVSAGFYEDQQPLGALVHSLEHGAVVVYYDPAALDSEAESQLREYADTYTDPWASVVVVPNPRDDPQSAYVLTAWQHRLRMDSYDDDVTRAFLAEFLGRGPENPIR